MEISFTTKDESKKAQEDAFLALTGHERFLAFIRLSQQVAIFKTNVAPQESNNFIVTRKS